MPIKFPKGFPRRKSSGNVLDELDNPPEPSFRVLGRSESALTGFSHSYHHPSKNQSFEDVRLGREGAPNRGSGATSKSASTVESADSSSYSARFGSSSTLPSSTDGHLVDERYSTDDRRYPENDIRSDLRTPHTFSLKAAGRTLSFGTKFHKENSSPSGMNGVVPDLPVRSQRSATASSYASTATPPKLDIETAPSGAGGDGFADMFANFGSEGDKLNQNTGPARGGPTPPPKSYFTSPNFTPSPGDYFTPEESRSPSMFPKDSPRSNEGLISPSSPPAGSRSFASGSPIMTRPNKERSLTASMSTPALSGPVPQTGHRSEQVNPKPTGLRRGSQFSSRRQSELVLDDDARLVMESVNLTRGMHSRSTSVSPNKQLGQADDGEISPLSDDSSGPSSKDAGNRQPQPVSAVHATTSRVTSPVIKSKSMPLGSSLFGSSDVDVDIAADTAASWTNGSAETTPRARKVQPIGQSDSYLGSASTRMDRSQERKRGTPSPGPNKVMTPKQFEEYRRTREIYAAKSDTSASDDSQDEDEDEAERDRQLAKQRRKQEAHLTVYRQQMMKITGENHLPADGSVSSSAPAALSAGLSAIDFNLSKGKTSGNNSDDEDEDIPLGILAAHGFPNKNRPPSAIRSSSSNPNLFAAGQSLSASGRPGSIAGDVPAAGRGSLPPFARHLPQDPYYGASIVSPSIRESASFGYNGGGSVYGGNQPNIPPGGLVGVIAEEERAKAMRRGSPNAYAFTNQNMPGQIPPMGRSMTMNDAFLPPGGIQPPMPGSMLPPDQAQMQMAQMTQMMQVQMQWMQQMMQMQGMGNGQMPPPPGPLGPPTPMQRPMTMSSMPATPQGNQPNMGMLDPNLSPWAQNLQQNPVFGGQGYAPSIAPSERSNIGMPSRYRPVSVSQSPGVNMSSRTSTFTNGATEGWTEKHGGATTIRRVDTPSGLGKSDEEDEEEGWEEMKKKREAKKSTWRIKKGTSKLPLSDVLFAVSQ